MDCKICELKKRQFFCKTCLKSHLREFRNQSAHFTAECDEQILKATRALEDWIDSQRVARGIMAEYQRKVEWLTASLGKVKRDNDKKRDQLRILRETLASRRRTLSAAKLMLSSPSSPYPSAATLNRESYELSALSTSIARARSGLIQELVEVFHVVEVGGRPPVGGKAGTKGEWTIGDLVLPVPGDIRRYPPEHINAVLRHTLHFLSLLTFYLGVKLPFEVTWTGQKLGVGQPWIGAVRGGESGGWAKWYTKQPLYLSSTPSPSPISPSPSSLGPSSASSSTSTSARPQISPHHPLTESYTEPSSTQSTSSFTTALSMLLYNISYLAYTQSVDVPLSQAGEVLSNLWAVCCSSELGRKSHETTPLLAPPTPSSFPLDFSQLLQATAANPRAQVRRPEKVRRPHTTTATRTKETIVEEEEEGWDLVGEDDGF